MGGSPLEEGEEVQLTLCESGNDCIQMIDNVCAILARLQPTSLQRLYFVLKENVKDGLHELIC